MKLRKIFEDQRTAQESGIQRNRRITGSRVKIITISEIAAENAYIARISLHRTNTHYDKFPFSHKAEAEGKFCSPSRGFSGSGWALKCPFGICRIRDVRMRRMHSAICTYWRDVHVRSYRSLYADPFVAFGCSLTRRSECRASDTSMYKWA